MRRPNHSHFTEAQRRRPPMLVLSRKIGERILIGEATLTILERGRYVAPSGREVSVQAELDSARSRSVVYAPDHFERVFVHRDRLLRGRGDRPPASLEVTNESTLHAARRQLDQDA